MTEALPGATHSVEPLCYTSDLAQGSTLSLVLLSGTSGRQVGEKFTRLLHKFKVIKKRKNKKSADKKPSLLSYLVI